MESDHNAQEIPEEFHSFNTGQPFDKCSDCERELLKSGELYLIEKAFRQYEGYSAKDVIFEVAICMHCLERIKNELSKESIANMTLFFQEMRPPNEQLLIDGNTLSQCLMTGRKKEELPSYQINAL